MDIQIVKYRASAKNVEIPDDVASDLAEVLAALAVPGVAKSNYAVADFNDADDAKLYRARVRAYAAANKLTASFKRDGEKRVAFRLTAPQ